MSTFQNSLDAFEKSFEKEDKMIIFEFDDETHNNDGSLKERPMFWISCAGSDEKHSDEIYEQLAAQTCGLTEEI